ncbi:MAG: hypothetical protein KAS90_04610 [Candidatus Aenigmarchaeota archaeon]|nr:hypothetical protein [Candidatus Aenigmarchaeota archaeon]
MDYEIKFLERDAVEKVEGDEKAKSLIDKNGLVLASSFAMITPDSSVIDRWNVNYFNAETSELTNFLVKGDEVTHIETSKRIHDTEIRLIDMSKITIPVTKILSSAMERSELEFPHETNKIFITLHHNNEYKNECWTITLFSKNLFLYKIKIDAITGKIVSSEVKHLLK